MAVIEPEGSGRKIAITEFALEYPEFPVEVPDMVKAFFDEGCFIMAVWIGTFCWCEVHVAIESKRYGRVVNRNN